MALLTPSEVVDSLRSAVPEFEPTINEHLREYGEVLLHVLFGDLTRFILSAHQRGDTDVEMRSLALLDTALREGNDDVENLIALSFVENIGPSDPAQREFMNSWPSALRAAARRQRNWKRGHT